MRENAGSGIDLKMTKANPYTQAAIERAIKAALAVGLSVVGVKPDGTVLTAPGETRIVGPAPDLTKPPKLRDAREKLRVG